MSFLGYGNFYYWFKAKLSDIRYLPREIKWYFQRANRGYADSDIWGFDYYLTKVILGGLRQLKENKCGYPITIWSKEGDPDKIDDEANIKAWNDILDSMIYAFEVNDKILNGDPEWYYIPTSEHIYESKGVDAISWFEEYEKKKKQFGNITYVMALEEVLKYEKGWENFRKYYFNLWD